MFQKGCRVRVLKGRSFDKFSQREEGIIKELDEECRNCEVLFDGRVELVRVALKHLRVVEEPPPQEPPQETLQVLERADHESKWLDDPCFEDADMEMLDAVVSNYNDCSTRRSSISSCKQSSPRRGSIGSSTTPRRVSISIDGPDIVPAYPVFADAGFDGNRSTSSRAFRELERKCRMFEEQAARTLENNGMLLEQAESCKDELKRSATLERQLAITRQEELRADLSMARSEVQASMESRVCEELRSELRDMENQFKRGFAAGAEAANLLVHAESNAAAKKATSHSSAVPQKPFLKLSARRELPHLFAAAAENSVGALREVLKSESGDGGDVAEMLLNAQDHHKRSVLHVALANSAKEVAREIIMEAENWASRCRHWHELQGDLVHRSFVVAINCLDDCGRSPLLTLCRCRVPDVELAAALLSAGGNPVHRDVEGMTPFLECARQGHVELGHLLLQAAGTMSLFDADTCGRTALHWAVERQHPCFVEFLLECGVPTELADMQGYSPLELALVRGRSDIADILTGQKANERNDISRESLDDDDLRDSCTLQASSL